MIDGAQSVPHKRVDMHALGCDFFVFSGHKLFAPMGIGVVYSKSTHLESMAPYQGGGDMIDQVSFKGTTYRSGVQRFEPAQVADAIGLGKTIGYGTFHLN